MIKTRLSTDVTNGICCLAYLHDRPLEIVPVRDIAKHFGFTPEIALRALRVLARSQYVRSSRGVHGGYRINRDPACITLSEFLMQVEGSSQTDFPPSPSKAADKYHRSLENCVRTSLAGTSKFLESVTVLQIIEGFND